MNLPQDSLNKRYFYKVLANIISLALNVVIQSIIPRGLGPKAYGDFNFLSNFFSQIMGFFDMGTSICFYTKLSLRPHQSSLVSFYFYYTGLSFIIIIIFVALSNVFQLNQVLWPDQHVVIIYLLALWAFMNFVMQVLGSMVDAYGLTLLGERGRIVQRCLATCLILVIYFCHQLNIINLILYHYIIMLFITTLYIWIIQRHGFEINLKLYFIFQHFKEHLKEFYDYSLPLFVTALLGLVTGLFDRWVLQFYYGSVEQGFYGLSYQVSSICILFTVAMVPLLTRELTIAFGQKDLARMARLFRRHIPTLYSIAAFFSCFIFFQAETVINIMGGANFHGALLATTLMALYPMHQAYGQLTASIFYATGTTSIYRNISIITTVVGIPLTYLLLAPKNFMGLQAGATGLALKMVLVNIFGVNLQLYFNARLLGLRFWRYVEHQFLCAGCMLTLSFLAKWGVDHLSALQGRVLPSFFLAGVCYTLLVALLMGSFPALIGLSRQDLRFLLQTAKQKCGLA